MKDAVIIPTNFDTEFIDFIVVSQTNLYLFKIKTGKCVKISII
jgi:hypothetical protein